jgi:hypothetical protein
MVLELVQFHRRKSAVASRGAPRRFEVPGDTPPLVREELEGEHRVRPPVTHGRSTPRLATRSSSQENPRKNLENPLPRGREEHRGAYRWTCDKGTPVPLGWGGAHPISIGLLVGEEGEEGRKGLSERTRTRLTGVVSQMHGDVERPGGILVPAGALLMKGKAESMLEGESRSTGSAPSSHRGHVTGGVAGPRFQALHGVSARLSSGALTEETLPGPSPHPGFVTGQTCWRHEEVYP